MIFNSNVNLLPQDGNPAQAIYASQLYGTFFGIFAQFKTKDHPTDSNLRIIKKITFTLINYKGEKNLNIVTEKFRKIEREERDDGNIRYILDITVKCNISEDSTPIQKNVDYVLDEYDYPNGLVIEKNSELLVKRHLDPMVPHNELYPSIVNRAFVMGHFDSEFFERDGIYVIPKYRIDIAENGQLIEDWPADYPFGSCTPGSNRVLF